MIELTKAELQQILTEVTKEYEDVVKSEQLEKMMGAPPSAPSALKQPKKDKSQGAGPGNPTKKLGMKDAFGSFNKEETTLEDDEESTKPESPKAEDPMPEDSKAKKTTVNKAEDGDKPFPPKDDQPEEEAAAPVESEAPQEAAVEQDVAQEQVPGEDAGMSPEQLNELYSALSPEHLAMHWMAASQALFQSMAGEQPQEVPAEQLAPPPAAVAPSPQGMPPMAKSEVKDSDEFKSLQKNFDTLKEQNDLLEKNLEILTDKLSAKLGMPVQNAVTSDTVISKSETEDVSKLLSKSEVYDLLKEKAKDQKLSDSDKKKIYKYSVNPVVTQELKDFLGVK